MNIYIIKFHKTPINLDEDIDRHKSRLSWNMVPMCCDLALVSNLGSGMVKKFCEC